MGAGSGKSLPDSGVRRYVCLICDSPGPLRRLRPERLYACEGCVRDQGGIEAILTRAPVYVADFVHRHGAVKA